MEKLQLRQKAFGSLPTSRAKASVTVSYPTRLLLLANDILYHFELFGSHGHKSRCRNEIKSFVTVTNGRAGSKNSCDRRMGTHFRPRRFAAPKYTGCHTRFGCLPEGRIGQKCHRSHGEPNSSNWYSIFTELDVGGKPHFNCQICTYVLFCFELVV